MTRESGTKSIVEVPLLPPGRHEIIIDGRDERGVPLASGVYFYRVETPEGFARGSIVILK